ncbi:GT-D fold domain-containing glycosyltransferase [Flavobacterium sp. HBTb2-11-1]|uniref:GT-D fold domain-containing glycosyltransferase n=1 Tax=Flavobacterium sp. HBTb2-11-1 TaxID=2692212 RepID=UPI00136BD666|nr:GT-D fold domain-containing glycosyltransferase [Flavobacterium sp. HBTb2-11-1]MXO06015.1 DUF1792 domain-containing protein [Flavobacterium sp. HBTb2-11-1]
MIKRFFLRSLSSFRFLVFEIIRAPFYSLFVQDISQSLSHTISIVSTKETLDEVESSIINNQRGAYLRFGDGDVFLMNGGKDSYQTNNKKLSEEMKEVFLMQGSHIYKCLAIHSDRFGYEKGMSKGNHKNEDKLALKLFTDCFIYFVGCRIYSPVALHFSSTNNVLRANSFLKTLKKYTKIFVGNQSVDMDLKELLFGCKTVHVRTPEKDAYAEIDRIENEVLNLISANDGFFVITIAMGCSGRPLMKRIWDQNQNVFLFDFGSLLDGISGKNSRKWLEINNLDLNLLLRGLDAIE